MSFAEDVAGIAGHKDDLAGLEIERTGDEFAFRVVRNGTATTIATRTFAGLGALTRVRLAAWSHSTPSPTPSTTSPLNVEVVPQGESQGNRHPKNEGEGR